MVPILFEMTKDECHGNLRRLELESYSTILNVFRAQGSLCDNKIQILENLRNVLRISYERHRAEARRVANDERLCTIAKNLHNSNSYHEWLLEGRRIFPLSRHVPLTAMSNITDKLSKKMSQKDLSTAQQTKASLKKKYTSENTLLNLQKKIDSENNSTTKNCPNCSSKLKSNDFLEYQNDNDLQYYYRLNHKSKKKKRSDKYAYLNKKLKGVIKKCSNANKINKNNEIIKNNLIEAANINITKKVLTKKNIPNNMSKLNFEQIASNVIESNANEKIIQPNFIDTSSQFKISPDFNEFKIISPQVVNINQSYNDIQMHKDRRINSNNEKLPISWESNEIFLNSNVNVSNAYEIEQKTVPLTFVEKISPTVIEKKTVPTIIEKTGPFIINGINKRKLKIISPGTGNVVLQPKMKFQNHIDFKNLKNLPIHLPVRISNGNSVGNNCITVKRLTYVDNKNTQNIKISKPNIIMLQTKKQNNPTESYNLNSHLFSEAAMKNKVVVIENDVNQRKFQNNNIMLNIENNAEVITEDDSFVDIISDSNCFIDNVENNKLNPCNEVYLDNYKDETTMYKDEQENEINTQDIIVSTTDWELELDQEVNKSRISNVQLNQKNVYLQENITQPPKEYMDSSMSNYDSPLNILIEEIIDDTSNN